MSCRFDDVEVLDRVADIIIRFEKGFVEAKDVDSFFINVVVDLHEFVFDRVTVQVSDLNIFIVVLY